MPSPDPLPAEIPAALFEQRVRKLCQQVVDCKSEAEAINLSRELQAVIRERIAKLRDNLLVMPLMNAQIDDPQA